MEWRCRDVCSRFFWAFLHFAEPSFGDFRVSEAVKSLASVVAGELTQAEPKSDVTAFLVPGLSS